MCVWLPLSAIKNLIRDQMVDEERKISEPSDTTVYLTNNHP